MSATFIAAPYSDCRNDEMKERKYVGEVEDGAQNVTDPSVAAISAAKRPPIFVYAPTHPNASDEAIYGPPDKERHRINPHR